MDSRKVRVAQVWMEGGVYCLHVNGKKVFEAQVRMEGKCV